MSERFDGPSQSPDAGWRQRIESALRAFGESLGRGESWTAPSYSVPPNPELQTTEDLNQTIYEFISSKEPIDLSECSHQPDSINPASARLRIIQIGGEELFYLYTDCSQGIDQPDIPHFAVFHLDPEIDYPLITQLSRFGKRPVKQSAANGTDLVSASQCAIAKLRSQALRGSRIQLKAPKNLDRPPEPAKELTRRWRIIAHEIPGLFAADLI